MARSVNLHRTYEIVAECNYFLWPEIALRFNDFFSHYSLKRAKNAGFQPCHGIFNTYSSSKFVWYWNKLAPNSVMLLCSSMLRKKWIVSDFTRRLKKSQIYLALHLKKKERIHETLLRLNWKDSCKNNKYYS